MQFYTKKDVFFQKNHYFQKNHSKSRHFAKGKTYKHMKLAAQLYKRKKLEKNNVDYAYYWYKR